jgi:hypothetical protein
MFLLLSGPLVLSAQTTPAAPCSGKPEWLLHVQKPDAGWDIDNIDRSAKLRSVEGPLHGPGSPSVVRTEYRIRNPYFSYIEVVADPCNHSASLRSRQLRLEQAYGYAVGHKTFAFFLLGECGQMGKKGWMAAACDTYVTLIDTTGSGKWVTGDPEVP